jgi:hypothetical protein
MDSIAVAIDAFALVLAGGVFLRRWAQPWRKAVAAFGSVACGVASPAFMDVASAPLWTRIIAVSAMFLAFCAVAAVIATIGSAPDDDGTGGITHGDWDPHSPDTPGGGTDDFEPDWWPEFEREFADYVSRVPVSA